MTRNILAGTVSVLIVVLGLQEIRAEEIKTEPFLYYQDFEAADPVEFWGTNGKYTVHFKGITEERAFSGKKSFKLDVTFEEGSFFYWQIPVHVPAEGKLKLSGRILGGEETTGTVGLGLGVAFPPTTHSGCNRFKYFSNTGGKWELIETDAVGYGKNSADGVLSSIFWGAKSDHVGRYVGGLGLFLEGGPGRRVVVYVDDVKLEGEVPVEAEYQQEIQRRWAVYKEMVQKKLADWRASIMKVEENIESVQALVPEAERFKEETKSQVASLKERIDKIEKAGSIGRGEHDAIETIIAQSLSSIDGIKVLNEGKGIKDVLSYVVTPISSVMILPGTYPVPGKLSTALSIIAASGEYEPASFVLRSLKDIKGLRIIPSDLKSKDGKVIPSSNVDVKIVKCWYQGDYAWVHIIIRDRTKKVLVPELLLNDDSLVKVDYEKQENYLKLGFPEGEKYVCVSNPEGSLPSTAEEFPVKDSPTLLPVDIQKGTNKQVWITVQVPEDASPGIYTGKIGLLTGEETLGNIELRLKVLPFKLSLPKTHYDLSKEFTCSIFYRGCLAEKAAITSEGKSEQQYRKELGNLYCHGVTNPTVYQGLQGLEKVLKMRQEVGMGGQSLYQLGSGLSGTVFEAAKLYGIPEVYFYGIDEATGERLIAQKPAWKAIHDAGGKTFVGGYDGTFEAMGDLLDILVHDNSPNLKEAGKWHSIGHRVWSCGNPQGGVENPEVYRRNFGLLLWKVNYDGAATYAYQHGFGHIWNDFDSDGYRDHNFTYPTVDGVIDTIAWEGYREAFDDIKYATTLMLEIEDAKKGKDEEKKKIGLEAEKYLEGVDVGTGYAGDLDGIRLEIIQYILKLKGDLK